MDTTTAPTHTITFDDKGKASLPRRRITKPSQVVAILDQLVQGSQYRLGKAAAIVETRAGLPPYSPSSRKANNQAHLSNFNTLEFDGMISVAKTPFYDILSNASPFGNIKLDADESARSTLDRVAADEFHRLVTSNTSLWETFWTMLDNFITFNKGFLYFRDPTCVEFECMPWHRILFPDAMSADPKKWTRFAIRHYYDPLDLADHLREGKPGWDAAGIHEAMARAEQMRPDQTRAQAIEVAQRLQECDVEYASRIEQIECVSVYVKEYSGRWSCYMVAADLTVPVAPGVAAPEPRWIYKVEDFYDSPLQVLVPFIYELGEGRINSFDGLGKKVYPLLQAKMRMENGLVDGAFLRQSPMIQPLDAPARRNIGLLRLGSLHVLPERTTLIPTNMLSDLSGPIAVANYLAGQIESNTAVFKPRIDRQGGNPETATGVNLRFAHSQTLTSSASDRFYVQADRLLREVWRRATLKSQSLEPEVKEFQERCVKRGIPREILHKTPLSITMTRSSGNGSQIARQQAVAALAPIANELGPRGRISYRRDLVAAFAGASKVDEYMPAADLLEIPDVHTWMADRENVDMREGALPIISEGQTHQTHLRKHGEILQAAASAAEQGGDLTSILLGLQTTIQHMSEHLPFVSKPEQTFWIKVLEGAGQLAQQVGQAIQQDQAAQANAAANQQRILSENEQEMLKIQLDARRKDIKQMSTQDLRERKTAADVALSARKAQADITRQDALALADIQRGV